MNRGLSSRDEWYDVNFIAIVKLGLHAVFIANMFAVYKYRQGLAKFSMALAPALVYFGMDFLNGLQHRLKANRTLFWNLRK